MPVRRTVTAVIAAAVTFVALAAPAAAGGCVNTATPVEGTSPDVRIDKCQFWAGVLRVPVGTVVTWTNADVFPHVVSGINWGRTDLLNTGGTFSHTFTAAGIYPYTCTLHPGMSAVVFVGDVAVPGNQPNAPSTTNVQAPLAPVTNSADGTWLATALLVSILVGLTGFATGRSLRR
jgi:plastocyanin